MKRLMIAVVLLALQTFCLPADAQTALSPKGTAKGTAARGDNCAPIGRTANGELVYSMKCENLPAPQASSRQASPPQAEAKDTAPTEPDMRRSGLFGLSYEVKRPDQ
jgi:hypothetical protein